MAMVTDWIYLIGGYGPDFESLHRMSALPIHLWHFFSPRRWTCNIIWLLLPRWFIIYKLIFVRFWYNCTYLLRSEKSLIWKWYRLIFDWKINLDLRLKDGMLFSRLKSRRGFWSQKFLWRWALICTEWPPKNAQSIVFYNDHYVDVVVEFLSAFIWISNALSSF